MVKYAKNRKLSVLFVPIIQEIVMEILYPLFALLFVIAAVLAIVAILRWVLRLDHIVRLLEKIERNTRPKNEK
jgi:hypothetical protein